jgi:hypothetical protein
MPGLILHGGEQRAVPVDEKNDSAGTAELGAERFERTEVQRFALDAETTRRAIGTSRSSLTAPVARSGSGIGGPIQTSALPDAIALNHAGDSRLTS